MTVEIQWDQQRNTYVARYPEGTSHDDVVAAWGAHERGSVGEGFCPRCRIRLQPYTSALGPVQLCCTHGWWQIDYTGAGTFSWWRVTDGPSDTEPLEAR